VPRLEPSARHAFGQRCGGISFRILSRYTRGDLVDIDRIVFTDIDRAVA
jgi:hypothetical protein